MSEKKEEAPARQPRPIPLEPGKATQEFVRIYQEVVGSEVDGKVGSNTMVDVYNFQRINRLTKDGIFGPATARAFLKQHTPMSKDAKNMDPLAVKLIQWVVGEKVDGEWGPKTDAAVREIQKSVGVKVDGVVGAKTLDAILVA